MSRSADLSPAARLFLLGLCAYNGARVEAVLNYVFRGAALRDEAKRADLSNEGLRRLSARFRDGLSRAVRDGHIEAAELIDSVKC